MKEYTLVNPTIVGTFPTTFKAADPVAAGKQFWEELTVNGKYITNHLPIYCFTLQEGGDSGPLHHLVVREKATKTGTHTEYEINVDKSVEVDSEKMKQLLREAHMIKQKAEQKGGKRKRYKDDDSSDIEDSDYFDYLRLHKVWRPITYWWYVPTIYHVQKIFTPTFNCPVAPYVELRLL